jgi:hypothetical protein
LDQRGHPSSKNSSNDHTFDAPQFEVVDIPGWKGREILARVRGPCPERYGVVIDGEGEFARFQEEEESSWWASALRWSGVARYLYEPYTDSPRAAVIHKPNDDGVLVGTRQ